MKKFEDILLSIVMHSNKKLPLTSDQIKLYIAKNIFNEHGYFLTDNDWDNFVQKLDEDSKDKLAKLSHFYYFLFRKEVSKTSVRNELILVTITSIIEAMMSEIKFIDFHSWFASKKSKAFIDEANKQTDLKKSLDYLWDEYIKRFGASKKIHVFFNNYLSKEDVKILLRSIKKWDNVKEDFVEFENIPSLSKVLYQMRSDFVHEAKMRNFCENDSMGYLIMIGKKCYDLKLTRNDFIKIFEKCFINYFSEKVKLERKNE